MHDFWAFMKVGSASRHVVTSVVSVSRNLCPGIRVRLATPLIDRLIHFTVYVVCTAGVARHVHFKQYYNSISTIYTCNYIIVMCIRHGWLGQQSLHYPIISSCLEISSAYNPFSSRFPFPVAVHHCNGYRVNGLHNILPLLPPGNYAHLQNSWHLLESYHKLFETIPTL